jgi:hypothetical protein
MAIARIGVTMIKCSGKKTMQTEDAHTRQSDPHYYFYMVPKAPKEKHLN